MKRRVRELQAPLIVFDPKHEYLRDVQPYGDELVFQRVVTGMQDRHAPAKWAVLRPSFDGAVRDRQFDRFCKIGMSIARRLGRCTIVIDELHLVTDAGRAPPGWRELVQTGRAFGCHVVAAAIRTASIDKDFWTNATYVRSGRLNFEDDAKRVAGALGVDWRELTQLPNLEYFERDLLNGGPAKRGRLTF